MASSARSNYAQREADANEAAGAPPSPAGKDFALVRFWDPDFLLASQPEEDAASYADAAFRVTAVYLAADHSD